MEQNAETKKFSQKFGSGVYEIIKFVVISLLIVIPFRMWIAQPFVVNGASMEPNFSDGDYLIVDEISYNIKNPQRYDIIIFKLPGNPSFFIKRIIGLPGETIKIKNNKVYILNDAHPDGFVLEENYLNNAPTYPELSLTLKNDEYFVMGDNRAQSLDSRRWGAITKDNITGRALIRLWPLTAISFLVNK